MAGVMEVHGDYGVRGPPFFSFFNFYFFLEIFPSMSFSLSIVAVLGSVRHLEVGVKQIARNNKVNWSACY